MSKMTKESSITVSSKEFTSQDALKRSQSIPWAVLVGPSGAGKSSLMAALLGVAHSEMLSSILKGEHAQTTKISTLFILDSRIKDENSFSIKVYLKDFNKKVVLEHILEELYKNFSESDYIATDTIDSLDEDFFEKILKPMDASFDLSAIRSSLDFEELKMALAPMLQIIEKKDEKTFNDLLKERRQSLKSKHVKVAAIRKALFHDLWDEYSQEAVDMAPLNRWLENVGVNINKSLMDLLNCNPNEKNELHVMNELLDNKGNVVKGLFIKTAPYNLIIEEMHYACKPHRELIEAHNTVEQNYPFRFAIRDTMGFTQGGSSEEEMEEALDAAFKYNTDSILILLNLKEREDNLDSFIQSINRKLNNYNKNKAKHQKPLNVLFTNADLVIEQKVNVKKLKLSITKEDYSKYVPESILEMEEEIKTKGSKIQADLSKINWLSLFYKDSEIDPIQLALKDSGLISKKFQPEGLYEFIFQVAKEGQESLLPSGQSTALIVSPYYYNQFVMPVELKPDGIFTELKQVQQALLNNENKKVYYDNIVDHKYRFNGRSVAAFWRKLSYGEGHKTRAEYYANFNLNMKSFIKSIIKSNELKNQVINNIDIKFTNLADDDLKKVYRYFIGQDPTSTERFIIEQQLDKAIRMHLANDFIYNEVIERVAFQASYGNSYVKENLTIAYHKHSSYDLSMRNVQIKYYNLFQGERFLEELAFEFGNELTNLLNKSFIAI